MMKRNILGRRRSDWIVPVILAAIAGITIGWALTSAEKNRQIERIEKDYENALQIASRDIAARDQASNKTGEPPRTGLAPFNPNSTSVPTAKPTPVAP